MWGQYIVRVRSLPPVIDQRSRCLILGCAPSELAAHRWQYYPDPYNNFWDVVATAFGFELPLTYDERVTFVLAQGLALWYVAAECERADDVDSSIKDEVPNDLEWLFATYPGIKAVLFNGSKARRLYRRYFGTPSEPRQGRSLPRRLRWATLPSTSATPVRPIRYMKPAREK